VSSPARAAAPVPVWGLVGAAALISTLAYTAVAASRSGCVESALANVVAVAAIGALGLALAALLLVASVPAYRALAPALVATGSFALSVAAVVSFLSQSTTICGF
jgi:hypothetical protein